MFRARREHGDLEARLRRERPAPRDELVAAVASRIEASRRPRHASLRVAFAGGLTAAFLVALASFGGLGYAAENAVGSVERAVKAAGPRTVENSAAQNQYHNRVTICHRTGSARNPRQTITVSRSALPAHQRHGDTVGPCVAGQQFTRGGDGGTGGVLGASGTAGGSLPFTGLTIAFAFFAGMALVATGSTLRRVARQR
jgi:hypothetical protein